MTLTVSNRSVTFDGKVYLTEPVVIVGPFSTGEAHHVHAAECGDLKRRPYTGREFKHDIENPVEVRSLSDVIDSVYGPEAGSFYAESDLGDDPQAWRHFTGEFKIFPCVSLPDEPIKVEAVEPEHQTRVHTTYDSQTGEHVISVWTCKCGQSGKDWTSRREAEDQASIHVGSAATSKVENKGTKVRLTREQTARLIERLAASLQDERTFLSIEDNTFGGTVVRINGIGACDAEQV